MKPKPRSKRRETCHSVCRQLTTLTITTACLLAASGCERQGPQQQAGSDRPPAFVSVAFAVTQEVPIYIDQIGKMVPTEAVTIMPQVGGKIVAVHFTDGASVSKDDLLFEIDPRPFEATLAAARASLAENKAQFALASDELKRYSDAVTSKAVSEMEYAQKYNAKATTEARVQASEAAVETARLNLEYTKIRSPIDGRAGARLVDPGNVVRDNTTALLSIQRLDPIYAEFTIAEKDLERVRGAMKAVNAKLDNAAEQGLTVEVELPSESTHAVPLMPPAAPATMPTAAATAPAPASMPAAKVALSHRGELTFLDNAVNSETGTIKLRATVQNADRYFWPGQFVNVRLVLSRNKDAVLIPAEAQQIGQQGPFVYVVNANDIAELRPIVPGQRQGTQLVVQQGVKAGDRVIVTGHMTVVPGGKVAVIPPGGFPPGMGGHMLGAPGGRPPGDKAPASGKPEPKSGQRDAAQSGH